MEKITFWCILAGFLAFSQPSYGGEAVAFGQDRLAIKTATDMRRFTVEIAKTPQQQQYGFMNRTAIPADHGMLFIEDRDAPVKMWMKDTKLPLDMLFIDRHGRIVYIATGKPDSLEVITASQPVRAVLELPGGTAEKESIKVGDRVLHSTFVMP